MIDLKNYQEKAVQQLLDAFEHLLSFSESKICVLESPTGSGKTLMVAEFLRRFVKEVKHSRKYSFIWISVRKLHDQSKEKIGRYYENDRVLTSSYFEDLLDSKINENEILFLNWQSVNQKDKNVYIRDNEQDFNLSSVVGNTKAEDRDVILIIDESHHTATTENSLRLISTISPKITLEVSATPQLKERVTQIVPVNLDDVREEEMIKSEISINPEFKNLKVGPKSLDVIVIEQALKKREELKEMLEKEKSTVNPLVLIQIPDKKEGSVDKKEEIVKLLEEKFDISEKNDKLAIWLSEDKSESLPNIEKNDNGIQVLIFKQAIALGWDCPRASILVVFRELKGFIFTIQTIGRIMRMPELKHYSNEELNKGYVFTNLPQITISGDYVKNYITTRESKRKDKIYDGLKLISCHLKRERERTRLSGEFTKIFLKLADRTRLIDKLNLKPSRLSSNIITDASIKDSDKIGEMKDLNTVKFQLKDEELQNQFDNFITSSCTPFAPRDSSDRMKTALYQFLDNKCKIEKYSAIARRIVLSEDNKQFLLDIINKAKEEYKQKISAKIEGDNKVEFSQWEIPFNMTYNESYNEYVFEKSVMEPVYLRNPSKPEVAFMEMLEKSKRVKWWFKNRESDKKYFAVYYKDDSGLDHAFYVDFIVKFVDRTIGLFDTKGGHTTESAKYRAEGLQKYISVRTEEGEKLDGGIVIFEDGSLWINKNKSYRYDPNLLSSGWEILSL